VRPTSLSPPNPVHSFPPSSQCGTISIELRNEVKGSFNLDPVSIGLFAGRIFFRQWALAKCRDASEELQSAQLAYKNSLRRVLEEQQKCIAGCADLAENRQAVLDGRWAELHTFLVACGVNGGLFAPPRLVFGKQSEKDVRSIITKVKLMEVRTDHSHKNALVAVRRSAMLAQGLLWLNTSVFHDHLNDVIISLSPEVGGKLADALGSFGDIEVGDFLGGALDLLSFGISLAMFSDASEFRKKAAQFRDEAQTLDDKCAKLEAANERIAMLLAELATASYNLFKWTVVGQESARLRRATRGRRRNISDLPRWILRGLVRRAAKLWSTLEKPVFLPDSQKEVEYEY